MDSDTHTHTQRRTLCEDADAEGRWQCDDGGRGWSNASQVKEHLGLPELEEARKDHPLEASVAVLRATQFVALCYGSPRN